MFGTNYNDHRMKLGYTPKSNSAADQEFYRSAKWSLRYAILPHRCELTKKIIWLENAYYGCAEWLRPGGLEYEDCWHRYNEHIIWELQK